MAEQVIPAAAKFSPGPRAFRQVADLVRAQGQWNC